MEAIPAADRATAASSTACTPASSPASGVRSVTCGPAGPKLEAQAGSLRAPSLPNLSTAVTTYPTGDPAGSAPSKNEVPVKPVAASVSPDPDGLTRYTLYVTSAPEADQVSSIPPDWAVAPTPATPGATCTTVTEPCSVVASAVPSPATASARTAYTPSVSCA